MRCLARTFPEQQRPPESARVAIQLRPFMISNDSNHLVLPIQRPLQMFRKVRAHKHVHRATGRIFKVRGEIWRCPSTMASTEHRHRKSFDQSSSEYNQACNLMDYEGTTSFIPENYPGLMTEPKSSTSHVHQFGRSHVLKVSLSSPSQRVINAGPLLNSQGAEIACPYLWNTSASSMKRTKFDASRNELLKPVSEYQHPSTELNDQYEGVIKA